MVSMDALEPSSFQAVRDSPISQLRTVGLGIFTNDGGGWVEDKHLSRGWFYPSDS